jgi:hypothetical protein
MSEQHQRHGVDAQGIIELHREVESKDLVAGHKIQVLYQSESRTPMGPNLCTVTLWMSGSRLGGGGDEKLYTCDLRDADILTGPMQGDLPTKKRTDCPPPHLPRSAEQARAFGCGRVLPAGSVSGGIAYCPHCGKHWPNSRFLTGEYVYKLPTNILAERLEQWWHRLEGDADLYIKYHERDIRYREMATRLGSAKARKHRGLLAYPLARLLRDTAAGKSVARAFFDCLSA